MYFDKIIVSNDCTESYIWNRICELNECAEVVKDEYKHNVYAALLDAKYLQYVIDRDTNIVDNVPFEDRSPELSRYLNGYIHHVKLDMAIYPENIINNMNEFDEGKQGYEMFYK